MSLMEGVGGVFEIDFPWMRARIVQSDSPEMLVDKIGRIITGAGAQQLEMTAQTKHELLNEFLLSFARYFKTKTNRD